MFKWQTILLNNLSNSYRFNSLQQSSKGDIVDYRIFTKFFEANETTNKIISIANSIYSNPKIKEQLLKNLRQIFILCEKIPKQINYEHIIIYSCLSKCEGISFLSDQKLQNSVFQLHSLIHDKFASELKFKFHPQIISMRKIFYCKKQKNNSPQFPSEQKNKEKQKQKEKQNNFIEIYLQKLDQNLTKGQQNTKNVNFIEKLLENVQLLKISDFQHIFQWLEQKEQRKQQKKQEIYKILQKITKTIENKYKQIDFIREQINLIKINKKQMEKQQKNGNYIEKMQNFNEQAQQVNKNEKKRNQFKGKNKQINQNQQFHEINLLESQIKYLCKFVKSLLQLCCQIVILLNGNHKIEQNTQENVNLIKQILSLMILAYKKQKIEQIAHYFVSLGKIIEKDNEPIDKGFKYTLSFHEHQKQDDLIEIFKSKILFTCISSETHLRKTLFYLVLYEKVEVIFWILTNKIGIFQPSQSLQIIKGQIPDAQNKGVTFLELCRNKKLDNIGLLLQYIINPKEKFICEQIHHQETQIKLESVDSWVLNVSEIFKKLSERQKNVYNSFLQKINQSQGNETEYKFKPKASCILVEKLNQFAEMQKQLQKSTLIGIDLQYYGYGRDRPHTCSIQIGNENSVFIIDVLSSKIKRGKVHEFIQKIMQDKSKIKIFHAYQNDIKWLHQDYCLSQKNVNVVDTGKIYAACIERNRKHQPSLKNLCLKYLNYQMEKKYQQADWRQRPLSMEMIKYAAIDSEVLPYIYLRILKETEDSQRQAFLAMTCSKVRYIRSRGFQYQINQKKQRNQQVNYYLQKSQIQTKVKYIEKVEQPQKKQKIFIQKQKVYQKSYNNNNNVQVKQKWKLKEQI